MPENVAANLCHTIALRSCPFVLESQGRAFSHEMNTAASVRIRTPRTIALGSERNAFPNADAMNDLFRYATTDGAIGVPVFVP
jgi:hypothetical protein